MPLYHLKEIVDIGILQEIQDRFSDATGLASITIDYAGKPITKYSNFTRFCQLIRNGPSTSHGCIRSDAHGGIEAARIGKPYIYKCHCGLIDFAIPIIVNGQYLGSVLAGQVKLPPDEEDKIGYITSLATIEDEAAKAEYDKILVMPYSRIEAAANLMFTVSNYIVEKAMLNIIQEELNNKNIKLMEEIKARTELEKALKDSEIKVLQSQINPHFMFNVLNTIVRLAIIEEAEKTQELSYLFAEMLRYVLKNTDKMLPVSEEIAQIERYLSIQSIRFGDRLKFITNIEGSIYNEVIPTMILQPLVENAMIHGIEPKDGHGTIIVNGYQDGDDLIFEIIDDGVGIPPKKVEQLLNMQNAQYMNSDSTGIGIANTNKRLILSFGESYKLDIKSKRDQGTTVTVRIPKSS